MNKKKKSCLEKAPQKARQADVFKQIQIRYTVPIGGMGIFTKIMKNMDKAKTLSIILVLASFAIGAFLYPQMPEMMASHWGYNGEVNGYMPKFWGLFLMPAISLLVFILFLAIPAIDPLKQNIAKFRKYFDGFVLFMELFLFYIYMLTIFWNRGMRFDMTTFMAPAMGGLFYYCGVLMENARPNWFVGIRTPWTLSSENVWNKTHRIGGKLFKVSGIISLLGILMPAYAIFFIIVPVLAVSVYTTVYSYLEFKKEKEAKK